MPNHEALVRALDNLRRNPEQLEAAHTTGNCVVLAGPGSGKTKTLTTAMARTLVQDIAEPRGVACITYNNECSIELEDRLARIGIESGGRVFIGTVHGFALSQVLAPYARCVPEVLPTGFRVASTQEMRSAVEFAHEEVFGSWGDPHSRWGFAAEKRRRDVDRRLPAWRDRNPELADFIEAYESRLRALGLIDFDDMPLLAYRMIRDYAWIRTAMRARFPVLFVDEYQDLGHALHELVLLLCFDAGVRLFAVGDVDQSIYGFTGANPELLDGLTQRPDVRTVRLRFNYRSGARIIRASLGALGEERDYCGIDGAPDGELSFWPVTFGHSQQAQHIVDTIVPALTAKGFAPDQIAVLYRTAALGDTVAASMESAGVPMVRADKNALVKRSSRLARFVEACADWVTGGWSEANPPYNRLLRLAMSLVYTGQVNEAQEQAISAQLIAFLRMGINANETTNEWLRRLCRELVGPWRAVSTNEHQEWEVCSEMVVKTDPGQGRDMPLNVFSGRIEGSGRITLSTLHSAKGREFGAVVMFGINRGDMPSRFDRRTERTLREARRLFYVGVTRARREVCLVYQEAHHSPWVAELYNRSQLD